MFANFSNRLKEIVSTREVRNKIIFSLFIVVVFRLLAVIPVIGIPKDALSELFRSFTFGNTLSTVTGGVLETASIIALGVGPYITASIVMQLLSSVIPRLEELKKEGSQGQRVISMWTRYLSIPLAVLQSIAIYSTLKGYFASSNAPIANLDRLELVVLILTITAGSAVMMWLSELIAEYGYGRGSGLLISLGVLSAIPAALSSNLLYADAWDIVKIILFIVVLLIATIYIVEGERRLKLTYSRRVRNGVVQESHLPMKLNQFGVMPVIFASTILSFPQLVAQFLLYRNIDNRASDILSRIVQLLGNPWVFEILTFLFIVIFSFFYVTIVSNPKELSENLQKQGAFIPGVRPGKATENHLRAVSLRLTAVGSLALALLSIIPNVMIFTGVFTSQIVTGVGLLIVVGVLLDVCRQVLSQVVARNERRYY